MANYKLNHTGYQIDEAVGKALEQTPISPVAKTSEMTKEVGIDSEGKLFSQPDPLSTTITVTIRTSDWSSTSGGYAAEVTVPGVTATNTLIIESTVEAGYQTTDMVTFYSDTLPQEDISAKIVILNNLTNRYLINTSLTNVTASYDNPQVIAQGETATLTFEAVTGYELPSTITVTGAQYTYDSETGTVQLSNPTANVTIVVGGVPLGYTVTFDTASAYMLGDKSYLWYSVDGGSTWNEVGTSFSPISAVSQIKFRLKTQGVDYGDQYGIEYTCSSLNPALSLTSSFASVLTESANYVLDSDVTISVSFYD